jgi:hypothetical protein
MKFVENGDALRRVDAFGRQCFSSASRCSDFGYVLFRHELTIRPPEDVARLKPASKACPKIYIATRLYFFGFSPPTSVTSKQVLAAHRASRECE